jgi:ribosomal protein S18 acetylase RimI-like enzyme
MPPIRHFADKLFCCLHSLVHYRQFIKRRLTAVTIRDASDADLLAVHHWLSPKGDPAHAIQRAPFLDQWVADHRGRVVGFVQLVDQPPEHHPYTGLWLFSLQVKLRLRGAGIGEQLTKAVIARARQKGAPSLRLVVNEDNQPAVRLYRKLGFEEVRLPEISEQLDQESAQTGRRRIIMEKPLRP